MKQLAWFTTVILATLMVVFLLWELRVAVILFVLSLAVAAILRPVVDFLTIRGLRRGLALAITYLAVVTGIVFLGLFVGGPVVAELQTIAIDLPHGYEHLKTQWLAGSWLQQTIAQYLPDLNNLFQTLTGGEWNIFIQNFLGMTLGSLDLIGKISIIFVLSIYWSADQEHFKRLWLSLLPSELRTRWRDIWNNIEIEIGSYLRSELIQSLLTVIILGIGYQLIGLKYPVLFAVFGAVGWLIIWFGGLAAVIPALLAGLAISPAIGLLAAFFTILVLSFLEFIVEPRLFKRQRLSSLLVVFLVLVMVKQFGIVGFLVAPPLAAVIQIAAVQLFRPTLATSTISLAAPLPIQIQILRERLNSVQAMISQRSEPPPPEIINLVARLEGLIDRANQEEPLSD